MSVCDEFLTTAGVAKLLQIGVKAAHARRARGSGPPFIQLGPRTIRYERRAVLEWLRSHAAPVAPKVNPPNAEVPCHHYATDDGLIHVSAETRRLDVALATKGGAL